MDQKISLAEAYEKAVAAIPGRANSKAWELCREEMRRNLATIFAGEAAFPVWKPRGQRVEQRGENVRIRESLTTVPAQSTEQSPIHENLMSAE